MVELPPNHLHVWSLQTDLVSDSSVLAECARLLSADERARFDRFRPPATRHLFLVAHAFVRKVLSLYAPVAPEAWEFEFEGNAKPKIARPAEFCRLRFNLSHTDGLALCGVARDVEIGVDVEDLLRRQRRGQRDEDCLPLAKYCLAEPEVAQLLPLDGIERWDRFLRFWTLKESYLKACATGLAKPLQDFAFTWPSCSVGQIEASDPSGSSESGLPRIEFLNQSDDPARWHFAEHRPTDRHLAAAAALAPRMTVLWNEFTF